LGRSKSKTKQPIIPSTTTTETPPKVIPAPVVKEVEEPKKPEPPITPVEEDKPIIEDRIIKINTIYFAFDSFRIDRKRNGQVLEEVLIYAKDHPTEPILIQGWTDPIGKKSYNQKLSERRAKAAKNFLIEKGIAEDRISILGMGVDGKPSQHSEARKAIIHIGEM